MTLQEPALNRTSRSIGINGRWRWWYASIADYRILHPGCSNKEVATYLHKGENTISAITNTDLYRDYEAQRRQAWREQSENVLRAKLTGVAIKALDAVDAALEKKKDQVPLTVANDILEMSLDRLGFGPKPAPMVVVNNSQQVNLPTSVNIAVLEEARQAIRAVEARKLFDQLPPRPEPELLEKSADAGPEVSSEPLEPRESQ